jgi:prepilin-type N-terminal cleavage/methylation domain-containing protein
MSTKKNGFTIVELLVVIGVIALLLGILLPALSAAKSSGRQALELSTARQLMGAYTAYAAAHKDFVLPGYGDKVPNTPNGRVLRAYDAKGKEIAGGQLDTARKRYVWRLAPYLNYELRGLYTNQNEELLENLDQQAYADYLYKASVSPSLGLNSEWVGGDADAYGFLPPDSPLRNAFDFNRYYVTAMAQARNPDKLLVFASGRGKSPNPSEGGIVEGYFRVRSPYFTTLTGYRWSTEYDPNDPEPANYGYLSPRYGGNVVTAFIDGHADVLDKRKLKDMRHWANWADAPDWRLPQIASP